MISFADGEDVVGVVTAVASVWDEEVGVVASRGIGDVEVDGGTDAEDGEVAGRVAAINEEILSALVLVGVVIASISITSCVRAEPEALDLDWRVRVVRVTGLRTESSSAFCFAGARVLFFFTVELFVGVGCG